MFMPLRLERDIHIFHERKSFLNQANMTVMKENGRFLFIYYHLLLFFSIISELNMIYLKTVLIIVKIYIL